MSKKKAIYIISYLSVLLLSFIYIKSVLKKEDVESYEETEIEVEKEYPVTSILNVYQEDSVKEYQAKSTNLESIDDFLDGLRGDSDLQYEKTVFTYGIEISSVFGVEPEDGYKWAFLVDGNDVTQQIDNINIDKHHTYELKMIEK